MTDPRLFFAALSVVLTLLTAACASRLAPHDAQLQFDPGSGRHLPPGSERYLLELSSGRQILVEELWWTDLGATIVRRGRRSDIAADHLRSTPSSTLRLVFPLGTDRLGRDCWSRFLVAGGVSIRIAVLATAISLALGVLVGAVAGFAGGVVDASVMRAVDALLAFPQLFVLLLCGALFDNGPATLVLLLGVTTWMPLARIVRAEIVAGRAQEFIAAAIAVGCPPARILVRHLLPQALVPATVGALLGFGDVILLESALSFLGFGVGPTTPTWGSMIAESASEIHAAWWAVVFPGLGLVCSVMTVNLTADALLHRQPRRRLPARRGALVQHRTAIRRAILSARRRRRSSPAGNSDGQQ